MKTKPSRSIILTLIIILTISVCVGVFAIIVPNLRPLSTPVATPSEDTSSYNSRYHFEYPWLDYTYVAHALGAVGGITYTNSYEAFLANYDLGHRVFEVDFDTTDDGKIILAHDADQWHQNATVKPPSNLIKSNVDITAFTYNNFMSSLWYGQYHPLDLTQLLHLMRSHPDIYIVIDSKAFDDDTVRTRFSQIVAETKSYDASLLDRFVVQIYRPEMLDLVMEIHPWKSVLYTLYAMAGHWTPENVLDFAKNSGIEVIVMWGDWVTSEIADYWQNSGLTIVPHTINNLSDIDHLRNLGVKHFFTDFLIP